VLVEAAALAAGVAVVAYGAIFVLLGLWIRRALLWGLAYILLWEGFVAIAGENAQRLAIRSYTRSLLSDITGVKLFLAGIGKAASIVVPLVVTLVAFALTAWRLRRTEVA
jgi:ABC-2 type transport system permease protein